jgi:hypothetical protein
MSKKVVILLFLAFCHTFLLAKSVADACLSFYTKGPDRYADGSIVMDGECYALVWSKDGKFDGFLANGDVIDKNDRIVLVAPVAKDGRCPKVLFQIPAHEADELSGGTYAVYLLDTRSVSGDKMQPRGTQNGKLLLMNGYGAATANIKLGGSTGNKSADEKISDKGDVGQVASSVCAAPHDCAQPRIKAMRIEGDNVFLTVENLEGFMRVSSGGNVTASDMTGAAVETQGGAEDVTLVTRKPGTSGFFKVIRNNN